MTYSNGFAAHTQRRSATSPKASRARRGGNVAYRRATTEYRRDATMYRRLTYLRKRRRAGSIAAAAIVIAVCTGATWLAVSALSELANGAQAGAGSNAPKSTPQSEWRAGEVPTLYQRDTTWANAQYGNDSFAESGCGPTCMAMVYVGLTGHTDLQPTDIGAISERMGCVTPEGTAWTFMTEGASHIGLSAEELPADEMGIRQALLSGSYVICSMGPGDFTSKGHFIVLAGIDKDGKLIVRDPNSPERTNRTWSFDNILGQARNLWAYSVA